MKEQASSGSGFRCHVCAAPNIHEVAGYEALWRVTSDCKPWPKGGRLCVCSACGCVQKALDEAWFCETKKIYDAYSIYYQSDGVEQAVFDNVSGQPSLRSERLVEGLRYRVALPEKGRLLDVGCGNGAFLRVFGERAPLWSASGTELSDKYRTAVEAIEGVEALYTCAPAEVPGSFDLISIIHALEHIPGPRAFLASMWDKLNDDGLLLVEIPDCGQTCFDLLVADHCTHFTAATATAVLKSAGYEVISLATDLVPKELTIIARKTADRENSCTQVSASCSSDSTVGSVRWLQSVVESARSVSTMGAFGLFGTAIGATWLFGELGESVSFFVDEDPHRIGKTHMGLPIYRPSEVPADSHVFIALPSSQAKRVRARMEESGFNFGCHMPPAMIHVVQNYR